MWVGILLTVIASAFIIERRTEAMVISNSVSMARAEAMADAGVQRAIFELYRNDYLLDSGTFFFDGTELSFTFQGARGQFEIQASHLVIHEPVRYLDGTWQKGTDDYAGYTGAGKAQFIYPKPELYGILGQLSGTIRDAVTTSPSPSHHERVAPIVRTRVAEPTISTKEGAGRYPFDLMRRRHTMSVL